MQTNTCQNRLKNMKINIKNVDVTFLSDLMLKMSYRLFQKFKVDFLSFLKF
jgi:hypothetical protein